MLLLSKLLMLAVTSNGDVSQCVCIFNFETVSSLYRALYEVRLCIPNILDGIKLHQAPGSTTETSQNLPSSIYWQVRPGSNRANKILLEKCIFIDSLA